MITRIFLSVLVAIAILGCENKPNYGKLPAINENSTVNCVVEIPSGTNHKIEYDYSTNSFPCDIENGKERVIKYLPYPANYGFIPSTKMNIEEGGDGDAVDVFILAESLPTGTVIEVELVGGIKLLDEGEMDDKLIAIPTDKTLQIISKEEVANKKSKIHTILKLWLTNYSKDEVKYKGTYSPEEALEVVKNWSNQPTL